MAERNANFKSSALYHGTLHPFNIGDVVEPRNSDYAYATPDVEYALNHVDRAIHSRAWEAAKRANPTYNTPGGKQFHEWAAEQEPKVFQVEPLGEVESTGFGDDKGNVMSTAGFRVVKRVK
jgi:hypothetical protein